MPPPRQERTGRKAQNKAVIGRRLCNLLALYTTTMLNGVNLTSTRIINKPPSHGCGLTACCFSHGLARPKGQALPSTTQRDSRHGHHNTLPPHRRRSNNASGPIYWMGGGMRQFSLSVYQMPVILSMTNLTIS